MAERKSILDLDLTHRILEIRREEHRAPVVESEPVPTIPGWTHVCAINTQGVCDVCGLPPAGCNSRGGTPTTTAEEIP
jgi:hypothetical protein